MESLTLNYNYLSSVDHAVIMAGDIYLYIWYICMYILQTWQLRGTEELHAKKLV